MRLPRSLFNQVDIVLYDSTSVGVKGIKITKLVAETCLRNSVYKKKFASLFTPHKMKCSYTCIMHHVPLHVLLFVVP